MSEAGRRIPGGAAAPGVALATAWYPRRGTTESAAASLAADDQTVCDAFESVGLELSTLAETLRRKGLGEEADILSAEAAIARDTELRDDVLAEMAQGGLAGAAIHLVGERYAQLLEQAESEYVRERAADIRQVIRRTLAVLSGSQRSSPPPQPFVLVDADVGPVDLLELASEGLAGAVSLHGGVSAHASIVARSLGIPLLIGIDPEPLAIADATEVLLDADHAVLVIDPSPEVRAEANRRIAALAARRQQHELERDLPAETVDGEQVALLCNAASAPEARIGLEARATGVGLLRTELPFLTAPNWPSGQAHRASLTSVFEQLGDLPVTVRLMDFSNDKLPPFLSADQQGLDALLANPQALRDQLIAVLDVGRKARTQVMLPMVRTPEQVVAVRGLLRDVALELGVPEPPLGIMVELLDAVDRADQLAEVSDFFSLGTNDLTASVLGLGRLDEQASPALAAHPKVMRSIVATVRAAHRAGIPVSVCGDAGGDPLVLPLLLGAGIRSFSVSPARVDEVRHRIRRLSAADWAGRVDHCLQLPDAEAVWDYVERVGDS
jgi:phosphoenolpyruvate-protein kinase (PTS system EI component)